MGVGGGEVKAEGYATSPHAPPLLYCFAYIPATRSPLCPLCPPHLHPSRYSEVRMAGERRKQALERTCGCSQVDLWTGAGNGQLGKTGVE